MQTENELHEESLDPEDWDALRALGHRMVDDMLNYLHWCVIVRPGSRCPIGSKII